MLLRELKIGEFLYINTGGRPIVNRVPRREEKEVLGDLLK